jgi:chromosome segregation ATPase
MSKKQENTNKKDQIIQTFSNSEDFKDFYLKELKTTHTGWVCINYNSEYLRERLSKLKEESNTLKQKITTIENKNLNEKNNLEKIILSLREDNNFIKQNYEMQKININKLSKEKEKLLNDINDLQILNTNLKKDKEILLEQIKDLNNIINNNISPKLKKNEDDFKFLENKLNDLKKINISLKNEKIRLMDDNNNKNQLIKVLSNQNKKLLTEIKIKYNKDLSFIESIENFGIEKNINKDIYKEMINKYDNDNDNTKINIYYKKNKIMNYSYEDDISNKTSKINRRNKKLSGDKKFKKNFNKTEIE